jgi:hypothetical protein
MNGLKIIIGLIIENFFSEVKRNGNQENESYD